MKSQAIIFPSGITTDYHFQATHENLRHIAPPSQAIIITDETVARLYTDRFKDYRVLSFPAGEQHKTLDTIATLTNALINAGAHRGSMLLGIGGGVVTDIVGYLGASFMRGVPVAFVPTTVLGQVDAAIGGKNGVNVGLHKNMLGVIRQPKFVLLDSSYLLSLATGQWCNGFAEIIKYGYISDARILTTLQTTDIEYFQKHPQKLDELIEGCVDVKNKIVHADEHEGGLRRLLNFGHTAGHAFETLYDLPHGHAVGLGMRVAMQLSGQHSGLNKETGIQLVQILQQFGLPTSIVHEESAVMELLLTDKKRKDRGVEYVLLEKPGVAVTRILGPEDIRAALKVVAK